MPTSACILEDFTHKTGVLDPGATIPSFKEAEKVHEDLWEHLATQLGIPRSEWDGATQFQDAGPCQFCSDSGYSKEHWVFVTRLSTNEIGKPSQPSFFALTLYTRDLAVVRMECGDYDSLSIISGVSSGPFNLALDPDTGDTCGMYGYMDIQPFGEWPEAVLDFLRELLEIRRQESRR